MEFRHTILLSLVIHVSLFAAAATVLAVRGPVRPSLAAAYVTLIAEASPSPPGVPAAKKIDAVGAVPRPAFRPAPVTAAAPPGRAEAPAIAGSAAGAVTEKGKVAEKTGGVSAENMSTGFSVISGGHPPAATAGPSTGGGSGSQAAARPLEGRGNGQGKSDAVAIIRAAIERAKSYPYFARKRGTEGTATASFTINKTGRPENIRIIRSSGSDILDAAALETIRRAAPFPVAGGVIEVPIAFRLEK